MTSTNPLRPLPSSDGAVGGDLLAADSVKKAARMEKPVSHEDIQARLAAGQQRFAHVEHVLLEVKQALQEVIRGQEEFREGQEELRETIKPISADIADIKSMVGLYQAAGVLGKVIKWISTILGGIVVVWVFAKAGAKALVGSL